MQTNCKQLIELNDIYTYTISINRIRLVAYKINATMILPLLNCVSVRIQDNSLCKHVYKIISENDK